MTLPAAAAGAGLEEVAHWRELLAGEVRRAAEESLARTQADGSLSGAEKGRRAAATSHILACALAELEDEQARLAAGWAERGEAERGALLADLVSRKRLEHELELRHNVNLTNDLDGHDGSQHPDRRPTERAGWSLGELRALEAALARVPAEHILGNRLLPPRVRPDGSPDPRPPGLEIRRGRVAREWRDRQWHRDDRAGALHRHGTIQVFDAASPALAEHVVHELGHEVEDAHGADGGRIDSAEGSVSQSFRDAAGWARTSLSRDEAAAELTAPGPLGRALPIEDAELTLAYMELVPGYGTPREATGDRIYQNDLYRRQAFVRRARHALPEELEEARGRWSYARLHPAETFAEQYAAAVNAPAAYHEDMIVAPRRDVARAAENVEAAEVELAAADDERDRERAQAQLDAARACLEGARAARRARKAQFDIMRNLIFRGESVAMLARASLLALPAPPGPDREARLLRFEVDAAAALTPAQIERLRAEAEADLRMLP